MLQGKRVLQGCWVYTATRWPPYPLHTLSTDEVGKGPGAFCLVQEKAPHWLPLAWLTPDPFVPIPHLPGAVQGRPAPRWSFPSSPAQVQPT